MRRGFTLIELIIVLFIVGIVLTVLFIGASWLFSGCTAQMSDNLIVNPLHTSHATIKVRTTYAIGSELGNIYRVYGEVMEDSDGEPCETGEEHTLIECPSETFEISDSFIDGNYRSADLFGELRSHEQTGDMFRVELRGERSGVAGGGSFRQIRSVSRVEE